MLVLKFLRFLSGYVSLIAEGGFPERFINLCRLRGILLWELRCKDGVITACKFSGGCHGNTQGVAALVCGMKAEDAIKKLEGIKCGFKNTSCPDQLARALKEALEEN